MKTAEENTLWRPGCSNVAYDLPEGATFLQKQRQFNRMILFTILSWLLTEGKNGRLLNIKDNQLRL